jgi:glycerophosphoryl diester phosphodiesterase
VRVLVISEILCYRSETPSETITGVSKSVGEFLCIGHRGARGHEPENTLRSVRRALALGARGIEIDVWLAGGELVVIHDAKLERTTNGRGLVSRKTFAYLRELDAGKGERIPTLREVFETVERGALINIELKGRRTAGPVTMLIEEFVAHKGWHYEDFLVSSFNRSELRAIKNSRIRIGLLLTRPSRLYALSARRVRACAVNPAFRFVNAKFVADAHRRGLLVFPYTVNAPEDIARLREMGVDGVFTDFPERVQ